MLLSAVSKKEKAFKLIKWDGIIGWVTSIDLSDLFDDCSTRCTELEIKAFKAGPYREKNNSAH